MAHVPIERHQLDNGLRVILSPDDRTPIVAVNLWYDVGSRNEERGKTGFAHLFEHMMFQGSANVAKGEHFAQIQAAGGTLNASTWNDRTNYFDTVPSHELELVLWLEADRMASLLPAMTQEKLDNQRDVVKNERRVSVDNQPYGDLGGAPPGPPVAGGAPVPPLHDRIHGRSVRGLDGGREPLLRDLLRPQQRGPDRGRRHRSGCRAGGHRAPFRTDPRQPGPAANAHRRRPRQPGRRDPRDGDRPGRAAAGPRRLPDSPLRDRWTPGLRRGQRPAGHRSREPPVSDPRPRGAAGRGHRGLRVPVGRRLDRHRLLRHRPARGRDRGVGSAPARRDRPAGDRWPLRRRAGPGADHARRGRGGGPRAAGRAGRPDQPVRVPLRRPEPDQHRDRAL